MFHVGSRFTPCSTAHKSSKRIYEMSDTSKGCSSHCMGQSRAAGMDFHPLWVKYSVDVFGLTGAMLSEASSFLFLDDLSSWKVDVSALRFTPFLPWDTGGRIARS